MKNKQKQKIKFITVYLTFIFGGIALLQMVLLYIKQFISFDIINNLNSIQKFAVMIIVQNLLFFVFLYISLKITNHNIKDTALSVCKQFKRNGRKNTLKYVIGGYLAFIGISAGISIIYNIIRYLYDIQIPGLMGNQSSIVFIQNFNLTSISHIIIIGTSIVLIAPIVEEIIYRGIITNFLLQIFNTQKALIISSIIFASIHMERSVWGHIFILSFILAYIYEKSDSLIYPILFHILVNGISFGVMVAIENGIVVI